jgi:DNA-binding HxlR family transcriptional regulator
VARQSKAKSRSGCPVSASLDLVGDRWSLLIVRDMMVRGYRNFREFQHSGEGIATNILTDRLQKLEDGGILKREAAAEDGRSTHYRLTAKGIALAPVLLELLIWGTYHEKTDAPCAEIEAMERNRAAVLAETYRRWEQRDTTPLIPPFDTKAKAKTKSKFPKGKSKR